MRCQRGKVVMSFFEELLGQSTSLETTCLPFNNNTRLAIPDIPGQNARPKLILTALVKVELIFNQPRLYPSLCCTNNHSKRLMRSERREAIVKVCKMLIRRLDINSMTCVTPEAGGVFTHVSMKQITRESGLGQRRCERAIRELKRAKILHVWQPRKINVLGNVVGCCAIRKFSASFFKWLGLDLFLAKAKRFATPIQIDAPHEALIKKRGKKTSPAHQKMQLVWHQKLAQIMGAEPDLPAESLYSKARQLLGLSPGTSDPFSSR